MSGALSASAWRLVWAALAAALLLAAPAAASDAGRGKVNEPLTPSRVLVNADEWSLVLSRPKVDKGPALIDVYNNGEDPHDLHLQRIGGPRVFELPELEPAGGDRLAVSLRRASRYRLWCSLEGHRALGMEATLKVSRKRHPQR